MVELNSLTRDEIIEYIKSTGEKSFRGEQIFLYFNKNMGLDIDNINVLSKDLREKLKKTTKVNKIKIWKRFDSNIDNTKKYLFLLEDGNIIESVLMKYKHGFSVCISTQIGCKMGCGFCASTKDGFIRNLSPGEMLNQIYMIQKDIGQTISNIVLMGSGEPLDNYENTLKFLNIIHDEKGQNISYRNITISTCGIVPKIYDLAKEKIPITLSISLHSPFDHEREEIMPINKSYKIDKLIKACKYYEKTTGRRITFEYTLIKDVNDTNSHVQELSRLVRGLNSHINVIPLNPIKEYNKDRPSKTHVEDFYKKLKQRGIPVSIRREMGGDISASCGQLRRDYLKELE